MGENNFIQVWNYLMQNDDLDHTDVLLMAMIISMNKTNDGCYMTNASFAKELRIRDKETISRRLSKLEKKGYIKMNYVPHPDNAKKTKRFITATYENGLIQKSIPIDSSVNPPLTGESIPPCLTSQPPIDSGVNTPPAGKSINNINLLDNSNNTNHNINGTIFPNKNEDPNENLYNKKFTRQVGMFISGLKIESYKKDRIISVIKNGSNASELDKQTYLEYYSQLEQFVNN